MQFTGQFQSTDVDYPEDWCRGNLNISLNGDLKEAAEEVNGTVVIEYTGVYRPTFPIPNPLPKVPVKAVKTSAGGYEIQMDKEALRLWEFYLRPAKFTVSVPKIEDYSNIIAHYRIYPAPGIKEDWGQCHIKEV